MNNVTIKTQAIADGIRARVLDLCLQRGGGYLSQSCSAAEIFAVLYHQVMQLEPLDKPLKALPFGGVPSAKNNNIVDGEVYNGSKLPHLDRFYLSPSHYCMTLYATLVETRRLAEESLYEFNTDGSTVEMIGSEHSPGMGLTTGSFGQAISQVAAIALARRMRGEQGNNWLFMSDGEFDEGQVWEALIFMAHQNIDTVGIYVDVNGQQVDGYTKDIFNLGLLACKCESFGAHVVELDGHDIEALAKAASHINQGKPLVVLAYTDTARGIEPLKERKPDLHYVGIKNEVEQQRFKVALKLLHNNIDKFKEELSNG